MKKKIYITVVNETQFGLGVVALCEDGVVLGGHVCSNESFIAHDMGIDTDGWKRDKYEEHCGKDNFEVIAAYDGKGIPREVYLKHKEVKEAKRNERL